LDEEQAVAVVDELAVVLADGNIDFEEE